MTDARKTFLFVGCGNMGLSLLAGTARSARDVRVLGLDSRADVARDRLPPDIAAEISSDPARFADARPDAVILALKPQGMPAALRAVESIVRDAIVVSVAAGVTLASLRDGLPGHARPVRAMPNLPASVGAGMTVAFAEAGTITADDRKLVDHLFGAVGAFAWLDSEDRIDAATAVSGSGPGYVFAFVESLAAAARGLGFDAETAALLARQTVIGAGALMARDERAADELRSAVTSPGGTTQAGLAVLGAPKGLSACLADAVRAAHARALQLAAAPAAPHP